ncbi:MAG: DUF2752 domain-containing protein [Acidimicrobiia bacterium]|nr:DUF2752 domain-containing protein [Acidimicrobiia bacterium]
MNAAVLRRSLIVGRLDARLAAVAVFVLGFGRILIGDRLGIVCPLLATTGIPCPLCGSTTSVTATLRFDLAGAFAANPAGIGVVAAALWVLASRSKSDIALPYIVLGVTLLAMWVFELSRFGWL